MSALETVQHASVVASLRATLERRGSEPDVRVLDDMRTELRGKKWEIDWATMRREKVVAGEMTLQMAVERFDLFVRPLLVALRDGTPAE